MRSGTGETAADVPPPFTHGEPKCPRCDGGNLRQEGAAAFRCLDCGTEFRWTRKEDARC